MLIFLLNILSAITGQLGPNYDPLFYDSMIYAYFIGGIIILTSIIVMIYAILKSQKKRKSITGKTNSYQFCKACGNEMTSKNKFCTKCGTESTF